MAALDSLDDGTVLPFAPAEHMLARRNANGPHANLHMHATADADGAPSRHSIEDLNPNTVLEKMDKEKGSANDLEAEFFEKFERRNWTFSLFEDHGRWAIRINPVSFVFSVILIWGFAVRRHLLSLLLPLRAVSIVCHLLSSTSLVVSTWGVVVRLPCT